MTAEFVETPAGSAFHCAACIGSAVQNPSRPLLHCSEPAHRAD